MTASKNPRGRPSPGAPARGARSVPALYGGLTAGLVALVLVVASVVSPATPPSIAELSPSARDRIEEARDEQGIAKTGSSNCAPGDVACLESERRTTTRRGGSKAGIPPALEVAAGRRCFGDPPRQTEDPHSPPCVFEIFKGDNGGATAPGVTATEIRVALPLWSWDPENKAVVEALVSHFNRRYEFYGRRFTPVFVETWAPAGDPEQSEATAQDLLAAKPYAVVSWLGYSTSAAIYRRVAEERVFSVVSNSPGFDSEAVVDGLTWLVDPPLDDRLWAGAALVCRAFNKRSARHAGPGSVDKPRKFAVVVLSEAGVRPDPGPLTGGLRGCGADFEVFEAPISGGTDDYQTLMLQLKQGEFTTVLTVGSVISQGLHQSASSVGYFPEWLDLGVWGAHWEEGWVGAGAASSTSGQRDHAFGFTPEVRVQPDAESPAMWALREGGYGGPSERFVVEKWYQGLLVLAAGIQGAGPNLTSDTFAQALRSTRFPNPNAGGPPYWQPGIGFGLGDFVFHDDYAVWWWNENAPSQTNQSSSGRGSFCYLDRGARFTAESLPANADSRLFSASEPCR